MDIEEEEEVKEKDLLEEVAEVHMMILMFKHVIVGL